MPWCDGCDRFYNPNTLRPDGSCPSCGRQVAPPPAAPAAGAGPGQSEAGGAPWHFKLLVVATGGYLAYRLYEGLLWVVRHL